MAKIFECSHCGASKDEPCIYILPSWASEPPNGCLYAAGDRAHWVSNRPPKIAEARKPASNKASVAALLRPILCTYKMSNKQRNEIVDCLDERLNATGAKR